MRWRSSCALLRLPKLKLAASCSAADAILPPRPENPGPLLYSARPPAYEPPRHDSEPSGVAVALDTLGFCVGAALLALARLAALVAIDLLNEGGGDSAASLFDRSLGA